MNRLVLIRGGAMLHIRNMPELFHGGYCSECGSPSGGRTAVELRLSYAYRGQSRYHAGVAVAPDHSFSTRRFILGCPVFSEPAVAWLSGHAAGRLHWRAVQIEGKHAYPMFELVGSTHHAPFVRLAGDASPWVVCGTCKWTRQAEYPDDAWLPKWMRERGFAGMPRPMAFAGSHCVPSALDEMWTAGEWFTDSMGVAMHEQFWATISKGKSLPLLAMDPVPMELVPPELIHAGDSEC